MKMDLQGELMSVAPYSNIVDQTTGEVSSGLSVYVVFDGDNPEPWVGKLPHKFWLKDHPQVKFFDSPEGKKFPLPKRGVFNCTLSAKQQLKLIDFKLQA